MFLYRPGEQIDHVYFLGGGFASVVTMLKVAHGRKIATIGREGMAAHPRSGRRNPYGRDDGPSGKPTPVIAADCYVSPRDAATGTAV